MESQNKKNESKMNDNQGMFSDPENKEYTKMEEKKIILTKRNAALVGIALAVSVVTISIVTSVIVVSLHKEELSDRIDENTDMVHVIKDEISSFKEVHSRFNRSVNEHANRINGHYNMIDAMKDEISSLKDALSTFSRSSNEKSKNLEERINGISHVIETVKEDISSLGKNLHERTENFGQRIRENSNLMQKVNSGLSSLQYRVNDLANQQRHASNGQSRVWMDTRWLGLFSLVVGYMLIG